MSKVITILIGLTLAPFHLMAQDFPRTEFSLEKLVDEIFPVQDTDLDYGEFYEILGQLLAHPLDLNTITREQLHSLFVVTEAEINSFISYREAQGPLFSVYEMQAIPGWNLPACYSIIPFVTITEQESRIDGALIHRIVNENNNYLLMRYERSLAVKKGYESTTDSSQQYAGTPDKYYMRYRVAKSNDFSIGFTGEKDAGEKLDWSPSLKQYGFDYLSYHVQIQNKGKLRNLILGDYQSQFGQGLVLGSVFGFGKNSETITTVRRSNLGFLPYTSLNENLSLKGIAGTYALSRHVLIHGFASQTFRDARPDDPGNENSVITSFSTSGLHRTPSEIQSRKLVPETDLGAVVQYKNQQLDAGIIFHQVHLDFDISRSRTPYNQYSFRGRENQNISAYLNYNWANFTFFSETAQTLDHGTAVAAGILGNLTQSMEISLLYRNYARDFYSFSSNAFAENTQPQNEHGFYWGWKYWFGKPWSVSGYMDIFRFPWLRYRGYSPSEGHEAFMRVSYTPSKNVALFLQAREESKMRNLPDAGALYLNASGIKRNFWINCDYSVPPYLAFKTRVQLSSYELGNQITRGFVILQDISFSITRWSLSFRYALFDADDFENRLYVYERDVWLAYSFPAYSGKGIKCYTLLHYTISQKTDIWLRWSQVRYIDRNSIGTGPEMMAGNTGNDIKLQVRIRF